jgi:signal transduction histidine kinase
LNQNSERLVAGLESKYFERKFDLVVADGAAALTLLLNTPPPLLQNTPVVFLSISDTDLPRALPPNVTGVATHIDYTGIVQLATKLQPDVRHVYYIQGAQPPKPSADATLQREFAPFAGKLDITFWKGLSLPDLLQRVSAAPAQSAILFDTYFQDPGGRSYVPAQVCSMVVSNAKVPVYVPYETMLGNGAAGGVLVDFRGIAHQATRIVLGLLNGGRVADFPIEYSRNVLAVDLRAINRFGLSAHFLPSSVVMLHQEPTMWERYHWYIIVAVFVLLLELALILALAIEGRKRRLSEASTRELAGRLIDAQEDERRRIARELHDDLSQRLAWACIQLDAMRQSPPAEELLIQRLTELYEETDLISSDVHHISHQLHPAVLERLGLSPALRQYCDEFSHRRHTFVHFQVSAGELPLEKEAALALFRVAQECLTNVAKHSGIASCNLKLERVQDKLRLTVSDKGRGFNVSALNGNTGLGLDSMRERLRSVGGTLRIDSAPSRGTSIEAAVSLAHPVEVDETQQTREQQAVKASREMGRRAAS